MYRIPSTDGVELAVHDLGGAGPRRPRLLLTHATGFHGRVFGPLAHALDGPFRCIAPDFRGHGITMTPDGLGYDWSGFGDDVLAVVDGVDGADGPWFGAGHSLGGAALLMAEERRPGTFGGLYLFEPIVLPPDLREGGPAPLAAAAERRRETFESHEAALANFAAKPPLNELDPEVLAAYVEHGFAPMPGGGVRLRCARDVEARIFRMGASQRLWEDLGAIACPVTVACGRAEVIGPAAYAPAIASRLPAGRLERFPDLGHFGPLESPTRLAAALVLRMLGG